MTGMQHHALGSHAQGEPFGPYEVYERLGVGGMATVHRAIERGIEGFERVVALKRLLPHLAEDADFVRSFVREAKLASQLQHINICQLYELGRVGAVYFISMEYIDGRDVRQVLRQARRAAGPPPIEVTVSILAELCDALDYAHHCTDENGEPLGLVHRDVSPSNLLLASSGHVKIIDFGIAKATSQKLRTQTGRVKGKLAYMSPEAIRGARLDARSDIFSVGVIAHELLTATPLFASKNDYETLTKIQQRDVEPPSAANPKTPKDLDELVLKALAKHPDDRFSSAGEFRDALDELRMRHQLNATNRTVKAWVSEAFAAGVVDQDGRARRASEPSMGARRSQSISAPVGVSPIHDALRGEALESDRSAPRGSITHGEAGDPARASSVAGELGGSDADVAAAPLAEAGVEPDEEAVEEVAEFAWGEDNGVPVILDEVPDVSHKVPHPPSPPPQAQAAVGESSPTMKRGDEPRETARASAAALAAVGSLSREDGDEEDPTLIALAAARDDDDLDDDEPADPSDAADGDEIVDLDQPKFWPEGTSPPEAPARDDDGPEAPLRTRSGGPRRKRSTTSIGMTIVSRDTGDKRRLWIGGAVAAVVCAGALSLFAMGGDSSSASRAFAGIDAGVEPTAAPTSGALARVTFAVQPEGAEILIDDELLEAGEQPHAVSLEPGSYRVEIRKSGYESWVETLEVGANEAHVIHKRLDPGGNEKAVLKVGSTPSGLRVKVDGRTVRERTPLRIEVDPGARAVEVLGPSGSWNERFDAAADTVYSFHPVFGDREERRTRPAPTSRGGAQPSPALSPSEAEPEVAEVVEPAPAPRPSLEVDTTPSSLSPLPFEVRAPPERQAGPREPATVSGADVQLVSGEAPALPARARGASQSHVTLRICIDERGSVSQVDVLTGVGVDVERALRRAIRRWTYRPYSTGGAPVPVCFRQTLRLP
jgi:serine/threonine protein kinase